MIIAGKIIAGKIIVGKIKAGKIIGGKIIADKIITGGRLRNHMCAHVECGVNICKFGAADSKHVRVWNGRF